MSKIQDTKEPWNGKTYSEVEEFVKEELDNKARKAKDFKDGNIAVLDSEGNPADSGHSPSEFVTEQQMKTINGQSVIGSGDIAIPRGRDAVNPFKGWFNDVETLRAIHPQPAAGDFAYVKGAEASDPADIFVEADGDWEDSGRDVDSSNTQTFMSSEGVSDVRIDSSGLKDVETKKPVLAKAADAMQLRCKLEGITAEEVRVEDAAEWHPDSSSAGYYTSSGWSISNTFKSTRIDVGGYKAARFIGYYSANASAGYLYQDVNGDPIDGAFHRYNEIGETAGKIEIESRIPEGAKYLVCILNASSFTESEFYCYLQKGETVGETIEAAKYELQSEIGSKIGQINELIDKLVSVEFDVSTDNMKARTNQQKGVSGNTYGNWSTNAYLKHFEIPLEGVLRVTIMACADAVSQARYFFTETNECSSNSPIAYIGRDENSVPNNDFTVYTIPNGEERVIEIPDGANYLMVFAGRVGEPNKSDYYTVSKITYIRRKASGEAAQGGSWEQMTFRPSWTGGNPVNITADNFAFGTGMQGAPAVNTAMRYIHTRILRVLEDTVITVKGINANKSLSYVFYDSGWNNIGRGAVHSIGDNTEEDITIAVPSGAKYGVLQGVHKVQEDGEDVYFRDMGLEVTMYAKRDSQYAFCPRPSDDGYQRLNMCVGVVRPYSSYEPERGQRIKTEYMPDFGVLCLPESYSTDGEPTRLIVFTHGRTTRYKNGDNSSGNDYGNTRFDSKDIDPAYWLSEGYAIMDMDANVSLSDKDSWNNQISHYYEPAAVNAYDTAYQWVVRHYNIRTDGVFTAGRSMGGGMQLTLAKASTMPILASAPIVPVCSPLGYVASSLRGEQRKELLKAYGVPEDELDKVEWTSAATAYHNLTQDEKDVIFAYQHLFAPYTPGYCLNRPYTEEELTLWSQGYNGDDENALYGLMNSIAGSVDVSKYRNIPFLYFTCEGDKSVKPYSVKFMHKLLARAGYNAQIHVFPKSGNELSDGGDHRFEMNDENRINVYTNSKGVELNDVPIVYIEILSFWRRFENQDTVS